MRVGREGGLRNDPREKGSLKSFAQACHWPVHIHPRTGTITLPIAVGRERPSAAHRPYDALRCKKQAAAGLLPRPLVYPI